MRRSAIVHGLAILVFSLTSCSVFPTSPKHTFQNWDVEATSAMRVTSIAQAMATPSKPAVAINPVATVTSEILTPQSNEVAESVNELRFEHPTPTAAEVKSITEFGIQINGCDKDVPQALATVKRMGLTWIKQQARWADIETATDTFDWRCMDKVIPISHVQGFKVLISVTTAPSYTRNIYKGILHSTNGRPMDFHDFGSFLTRLVARYPHQIQALELWNEPNLMREWGDALDGGVYALLLAAGYDAVKASDPSIMVISAGVAPTGFSAQWEALDDAVFLRQFIDNGGLDYADCIGAHANGPDGVGEIQLLGPRYFGLTNRSRPICFTEFGYAVPIGDHAPEGFGWIMTHTAERQTEVLLSGMHWARQSGYVRLVFLWNLNFDGLASDPNTPYSLVRAGVGWESPALGEIKKAISQKP